MENMINRRDPKWAHPEIGNDTCWAAAGVGDNIMNKRGLTKEQQKEMQAQMAKSLDDMYNAYAPAEFKEAGTWTNYYTEKGCPEEPDAEPVRILVRKPNSGKKKYPAIFIIAGGGLVDCGVPEQLTLGMAWILPNIKKEVVVVGPQYRLAPSNKYPAAINDLHAAYIWMLEHADELNIDIDKVVLFGASSGGHLSLSFGFRLQKYNFYEHMPCGIVAIEPVMDDIAKGPSGKISFRNADGGIDNWDGETVIESGQAWLGDLFDSPDLLPEAFPNRATVEDFKKGYPPTWIPAILEFDPGRDSALKFVSKMQEAGIFCDAHIWGGSSHLTPNGQGFDLCARMNSITYGALNDAYTYDFRRPWVIEE